MRPRPSSPLYRKFTARFSRAKAGENSHAGNSRPFAMKQDLSLLPDRYRDPGRVGVGGMGEVYRAEDTVLGRVVAVKLLAERYSADEAVRQRFTREALAAARLSGEPNTVTIFDVGEHEQRPFIVMEYLHGGSLEDRLRDHGAQQPAQVLEWLEQAGAALDAAHRNGIVHRDVKPGNLLLAADGTVRVADFGVASAAGLDSLTITGTVLGTAGYLAPEQARGEPAKPASDLYALAVVAFELLTGRRPYEADTPTAEASAHVHAEIPLISDVTDLPPQVDHVFLRALAKDPAQRYRTAGDFVSALREALRAGATVTTELEPTVVVPPPRRGGAPIGAIVGAVLLALALAGAGLAALLTRDGDGESASPQTVTQVTTVAGEPTTETVVTTTEAPPPPPPPQPPPEPPAAGGNGVALTDQATRLLEQGRYGEAESVARQAVAALEGSSNQTYLAYALYDLGAALAAQEKCDEAVPLLERSEQIQGSRAPITQAKARCGVR
jgi:predicted Ser/Thr protein kinase